MPTNIYLKNLLEFKELLEDYIDNLFSLYEHELELKLANYNVLCRKNNNIESSTAIGYILEEFVISKLNSFTEHKRNSKFIVYPAESPHLSYDCYATYEGIKFLINIKSSKKSNDAVAAIGKLRNDYCSDDNPKSFVLLKIYYSFIGDNTARKIKIKEYDTVCIEEVDFSEGHRQDHRSWSKNKTNDNSGRLQISKAFIESHIMPADKVSFMTTRKQIEDIYAGNNIEA